MKKISVLLVLIAFFFTASASDGTIKKNKAIPPKNVIKNTDAPATKQPAIEQKTAQAETEAKKVVFDCNGSATFYCAGEIVTVYVTVIGDTQTGDCINFARAVSEFLQEYYCGVI